MSTTITKSADVLATLTAWTTPNASGRLSLQRKADNGAETAFLKVGKARKAVDAAIGGNDSTVITERLAAYDDAITAAREVINEFAASVDPSVTFHWGSSRQCNSGDIYPVMAALIFGSGTVGARVKGIIG